MEGVTDTKGTSTPPIPPWGYLGSLSKTTTAPSIDYSTVVRHDTLKKITVEFSERLQQHHLATIFCPDVLVAQTIFKAIPLFPLVSQKNVKAPRPELVVPIPIFFRLFRSDKNGDLQF